MNSSRTATMTSSTFRLPLGRVALSLALVLLPLAGSAAAAPSRPPVLGDCEKLQVEAGNRVVFHVYAVGVQIYSWNGTTWNLVGPDAVLYADAGHQGVVGTHYAGPTWESTSGSVVVGTALDRCTADPDAVPWLLLKAASSHGPGVFQNVTYIQRVNTTGGVAPSDPGTFVGEEVRIPYTAEYYFYR
jgi:hypothetical protein